mgnify:CR=1 FL=1
MTDAARRGAVEPLTTDVLWAGIVMSPTVVSYSNDFRALTSHFTLELDWAPVIDPTNLVVKLLPAYGIVIVISMLLQPA